jgi:penicillin-binding protein 2
MRLAILFLCILILFVTLILRVGYLQFVQGEELTAEKNMRMIKDVPIAPIRGNIYDRVGQTVAKSTSTQSLFYRIEPNTSQDDTIQLAYRLAEWFGKYGDPSKPSMTPNDVILAMEVGYDINKEQQDNLTYSFYPRRIKSGLSNAEIAYFMENRNAVKGIEVVEESIREYDERGIAVQMVGYLRNYGIARNTESLVDQYGELATETRTKLEMFIDTEDVGYDGIELLYQDELRGMNGLKSYPVNSRAQIVGDMTITPPVKGNNLYLSIDHRVQLAAEQAILDQLDYMKSAQARAIRYAYAPYARAGYAVAMEVKTGKVVAMASMPDYDPNIWRGGITRKERDNNKFYFSNGTISSARPYFSSDEEVGRHPTSIVPLGSTIKPLTVLLGLNEKLFSPYESYNDTGTFFFGRNKQARLSNSNKKAYGYIDAREAIRVSSNTFMAALIGNRLAAKKGGVDTFDRYMKAFGLGTETGSDLPNEHLGIRDYIREAERNSAQSALIYASFGQQGKYTTLQLAQFSATLANEGKRLKPLFVDKVTDSSGKFLFSPQHETMSSFRAPAAYWNVVKRGMEQVTETGRVGELFQDFPHKVASKTGTSQSDIARQLIENSVFISYAPADKPVLAVAVVVPEGGYGAWNAAPIARKIYEAYDLAIGMTGTPRPVKPPETEGLDGTVNPEIRVDE